MFGIFIKFTDKSVQLAQTLFMALAALELGWTLIRWMVSQVPLEEYVANSFFKIVQMALLYIVISNSYSSPFGPGWFMMIVYGIVGMAQDTAGVNVVGTSDTGQFTPVITPGTIIDIGLRLFVMIMTGASQGVNGWNLLAGLTTGATLIYFGTWLFCLCSAVGMDRVSLAMDHDEGAVARDDDVHDRVYRLARHLVDRFRAVQRCVQRRD